MLGRATRIITFVVLLLGIACVGNRYGELALAAPQPDQTVEIYIPFLPIISQPPSAELKIAHMGMFQSVQSPSNDVSLIAGKPAMLRVYAQASQITGDLPFAVVTVEAKRDGITLGALSIGQNVVTSEETAENLESTFNFDLPLDWLQGKVTLTAEIDALNSVVEFDEKNNSFSSTFTFQAVPPLDLTIVPITYTDTVTGITFSQAAHDDISSWLLSAFSVSEINVDIRAPINFTGDLRQGEEWGRLLTELTSVWAAEAGLGSAQIYYGLVPNSAPGGQSWFPGGISGIGWIGQRVSLGIDFGEATGMNAGHEIGHNLGRKHAPCGNPGGVDPLFPYPNASIGVYGVDTTEEILLAPELTHDVMSYCGPQWVSDYTYEALMQDQMIKGDQVGSETEGLLLSASLDATSQAFKPLPSVNLARITVYPQLKKSSTYQVHLFDANETFIGSYPATLFEAEEDGVTARMLMAFVPSTAETVHVSAVRFLEGDEVIAEQVVKNAAYEQPEVNLP